MKNTALIILCIVIYGSFIYCILEAWDSSWETRAKNAGYYCNDLTMVNPKDLGYCFNKPQ